MNHLYLICLISPLLAITSCGTGSSRPVTSPAATLSFGSDFPANTQNTRSARHIEKSGRMRLKTRHLKASSEKSVALVQTHQGTLATSSLTESQYDATIRVPSSSLEPLMESLRTLGKVTHQKIEMDDVTERYLDLQATLKNKRALRDRLRKLLTSAKSVKDTLKIEKELTRIQTELDQMEGKMKAMQSRISHSTLNLSLERESIPGPVGAVSKSVGWIFGKLIRLN